MEQISQKLNEILASMETYQRTYPDDACIILCDQEQNIIGYLPGKQIDIKIQVGQSLSQYSQSVMAKVYRTGQIEREERSADFLGIAYVSTATPIEEDGEMIGVLAAVSSNKKFDTLRVGAAELTAVVEEMSATTEQVTLASGNMAGRLQDLSEESELMAEETKQVGAILQLVENIASQSHLLGLNAAIEAARAGEHGRGFSVVAQEIRKMADNSNRSINEVKEQLQHITQSIQRMNEAIQEISASTEEHASSMQELSAAFQHIAAMADQLMNASELN